MYSEKTFKNYIFWIQVKRVVLIILLSCIGAAIGVLVSELLESLTKSNQYNVIIIIVSTIIMFFLSLLLTTGTGKEVQDGYWKIAVLRKLTTIQKLIETNNALMGNNGDISSIMNKNEINKLMVLGDKTNKEIQSEHSNDLEYEEDSDLEEKQGEKIDKENNKNQEKNKRTIKLNKKDKKTNDKKSNSEKVEEKV